MADWASSGNQDKLLQQAVVHKQQERFLLTIFPTFELEFGEISQGGERKPVFCMNY